MRRVNNKDGSITFRYTGDLQKEIDKAKSELEAKRESGKQKFLEWQYEKAKKELETFNRRMNDLQDFIRLAENKIQEKKGEKQEGE